MNLNLKKFYYINCTKPFFSVSLKDFYDGAQPILWHNKGMYKLIPLNLVNNAIELLHDTKQFNVNGDFIFMWKYIINIPQEIGDQLTNKEFNYQTEDSND